MLLSTTYILPMFSSMEAGTDTAHTAEDSRQALIDAIKAYIARKKLTRTGFGRDALSDGSFLARLGRGSDVRLDTADKVLSFMKMAPIGPRFLCEIKAFLKVTRMKPHLFGEGAMRDPTFVLRLERGRSSMLATVDRVRAFMAANASAAEREAVRAAVEDAVPAVPAETAEEEEREMNGKGYINTKQAAAYLGLSPRTLESYRTRGAGPLFYRFGNRIRYLLSDVLSWASKRRMRSTSDDGVSEPTPDDEDDGEDDGEGEGEDGGEDDEDGRDDGDGENT